MSDRSILEEQYRGTSNLWIRKSLHEKYSVNPVGFQKWIFDQYPFRPGMRILELGSGGGEIWEYFTNDASLMKSGIEIILSDISGGMTEHLRRRFAAPVFSVERIDILDIPYADETFDLVIANSMLYHVEDVDAAIAEVRRVLKKDGLFFAATIGIHGMTEYLDRALDELGIPYDLQAAASFTLQNGAELLEKRFARVERRNYADALKITDVEDYLDYIYTMSSLNGIDPERRDELRRYFTGRMTDGYLYIPKENGTFIAGGIR